MKKRRSITDPQPQGLRDRTVRFLAPLVTLAVLTAVWLAVTEGGLVAPYLLPSPLAVGQAFVSDLDILFSHAAVTLQEALAGLGLGILVALGFALLMDRFALMKKAFYPLLVISQTIPTIAIAPLLILWMGFEMEPKVALVVLTTFFPITLNLLGGFEGVDPDQLNLLRTMGANRFQIYYHVKFPAAIEPFYQGLRISASYAIVGAVVAEWLGGFEGLGVYMTRVRAAYAFDKMFAVIVLISALSLLLVGLVSVLRWISLPWQRKRGS